MSQLKIDILFPVLNEHLRLENGIRKTMEYLKESGLIEQYKFRLLILDNGSDDDTPDIARRLDDEYPEVQYVRINQRGVGIAFRTGVEMSDADIIGTMDIDLSTDISYLGKTIRGMEEHPKVDYVNASRFHRRSQVSGRKWYRKITSMGLLILLKAVFGMKVTDAICGFTFVRRDKALLLVGECYPDNGWFYMIEFLLRAERHHMHIIDLPVKWQEDYNTTVHVGSTVRNYLKNIVRLRKDFYLCD